jgi:hypothetical protein
LINRPLNCNHERWIKWYITQTLGMWT